AGVDDGALLADLGGHRLVEPGVERHIGEEGLRSRVDGRERRAVDGVEEGRDRFGRSREIVVDARAVATELDADGSQSLALGRVAVAAAVSFDCLSTRRRTSRSHTAVASAWALRSPSA